MIEYAEIGCDEVLGLRAMIESEDASLEREVESISNIFGKMSDVVARLKDE